jgi:methionine sulfoxide reductase heme-binding subunit
MTDPSQHLFWVTSRAAGTTAIVLASVSVGVGLTMGGKLIKRGTPDRRALHEVLSLSVLVAIAIHGLSLLGDKWLHPSVFDITVPFVSSYKTLPTSIGIVAGWGLIALGLSYYARARIGNRRWKSIHRWTALAWVLGLVHGFTEGGDAGRPWFIALVALTAASALVLLAVRHVRRRTPTPGRSHAAPTPLSHSGRLAP